MKIPFLFACLAIPLVASDAPPAIPSGNVTYTSVDNAPATDSTGLTPQAANSPASPAVNYGPESLSSSAQNLELDVNLYTSNYNVRGMGVNNDFSEYGYSSVGASYTLDNRNLLGFGISNSFDANYGIIWGAGGELAKAPMWNLGYNASKEVFPNLILTGSYNLNYGGLEGYMAKAYAYKAHRVTQDLTLSAHFDDKQQGFFGEALMGLGFQGLRGLFWDFSAGYRFSDVYSHAKFGLDVEVEAGMSLSHNYWVDEASGVDAFRLRATFKPYDFNGKFGRDSRFSIAPWVQLSWAGSTKDDIHNYTRGRGVVDQFQFTIGIEGRWTF